VAGRGQAAFEQDDHEGDDGDGLGQLGVVEAHEREAVVTDEHAQAEEQEQAGDAQPAGQAAEYDADGEEHGPAQQVRVDVQVARHRFTVTGSRAASFCTGCRVSWVDGSRRRLAHEPHPGHPGLPTAWRRLP
jgi:hypothetical protein